MAGFDGFRPQFPTLSKIEKRSAIACCGSTVRQFTLAPGYRGCCEGDDKNGKERAEIIGETLSFGTSYRVSFMVRFDAESMSSHGTKFFQIHQYKVNEVGTVLVEDPIFMLSLRSICDDKKMEVYAQPLLEPGKRNAQNRHNLFSLHLSRKNLECDFVKFEISFKLKPGSLSDISVKVLGGDGSILVDDKSFCAFVDSKGDPRLKFGMYRDACSSNDIDRVTFCDLELLEY